MDEAKRQGPAIEAAARGFIGAIAGHVRRAEKAGVAAEIIVQAAEEMAHRDDVGGFKNVVMDLARGNGIGRKPAPRQDRAEVEEVLSDSWDAAIKRRRGVS